MTQLIAYNIIKALGGSSIPSKPVHIKDIVEMAKGKYPEVYRDKYLHTGLGRLKHWKYVKYDNISRTYTIIEAFPEPNIHYSPITEDDIITEDTTTTRTTTRK